MKNLVFQNAWVHVFEHPLRVCLYGLNNGLPLHLKGRTLPSQEMHFPLGDIKNPIKVKGREGASKYLSSIRKLDGLPFFFHRLGSFYHQESRMMLERYHVISVDGRFGLTLYLDIHASQTSILPPQGLKLVKVKQEPLSIGQRLLPFGVHERVLNFPFSLPDVLMKSYHNKLIGLMARFYLKKYWMKGK